MDHNIQYKTYSLHALCTHNLVFKSGTEFKFIVSELEDSPKIK